MPLQPLQGLALLWAAGEVWGLPTVTGPTGPTPRDQNSEAVAVCHHHRSRVIAAAMACCHEMEAGMRSACCHEKVAEPQRPFALQLHWLHCCSNQLCSRVACLACAYWARRRNERLQLQESAELTVDEQVDEAKALTLKEASWAEPWKQR